MKITTVISSMNTGGAERAAALLSNAWSKRGEIVSLVTFNDPEAGSIYTLHDAIRRYPLDFSARAHSRSRFVSNILRVRTLQETFRQLAPDVIVSSMDQTNVLSVAAARALHIPVIAVEQVNPQKHRIGPLWETMRLIAYARATAVVAVSQGTKDYFFKWLQRKIVVIPNPIDIAPVAKGNKGQGQGRHIIAAMGRLTAQKGFDLLIESFRKLCGRAQEWDLQIWGEGPLRDKLQAQIDAAGLHDRIRLCGITSDAASVFCGADIFVMSSRYEGFPLALGEAMLCGLPVVSFDCPSGPGEMIEDGINGLLVAPENTEQLAAAMERLMNDAQFRERLAARAPGISERYGIDAALRKWDRLFENVIHRQPMEKNYAF